MKTHIISAMKKCRPKLIQVASLTLLCSASLPPTYSWAATNIAASASETTFDTASHPKANGARVSVRYPVEWSAREGSSPRAIQHFYAPMSLGKPISFSLMMESDPTGDSVEATCASMSKQDWAEILTESGIQTSGIQTLDSRILRHQGKPAFLWTFQKFTMFEGKKIHSVVQMLSVCTGSHLVKLSCNTGGKSSETAQALLKEVAPLCDQYYGSLVVQR